MDSAAVYLALPEPDRAQHLWRYTPWHRIHPTGKHADLPESTGPPTLTLSLLDGEATPEGVTLTSATPEDLAELCSTPHDDVASTLIRALSEGQAVVLRVDRGTILDQPLLLDVNAEGEVCSLHLLLDIGVMAELEIVTSVTGDADWFGILREGRIGAGAHLNDVVVNRLGAGQMLRVDGISLDRDSQVQAGTVGAGAKRAKADLRYELAGPGASIWVNGSMTSMGKQHNDHHIEILHEARETFSRLAWHSACGGRSRTVGTGMLRIVHGARGSDAAQLFHNLLLSKDAEADSIPELEVLENEVVGCGHGTASGPIDEDQIFYLQSRGFSIAGARAVIITAFLNATLTAMGSETLHGWLNDLLSSGLPDLAM